MNDSLLIEVETAYKKPSALFDFKAKTKKNKQIEAKYQTSYKLVLGRVKQKEKESESEFSGDEIEKKDIVDIKGNVDECFIVPARNSKNQLLWRVVKSNGSKKSPGDYILKENDIVKLGIVQLRLLYMKLINDYEILERSNSYSSTKSSYLFNAISLTEHSELESIPKCRVCLKSENSFNNILLRACDCSGENKYVHSHCLKQELQKKIIILYENESIVAIDSKSLICSKCLQQLKIFIRLNHEYIDLLGFKQFDHFVVFEKPDEIIYVVNLSKCNEFTIGKNQKCLVQFKDESISDIHCKISFYNGSLYLKDCDSKYGTVVAIQKPLFIDESPTCIQVGNSLVKIKKKPKKWFFC